MVAQKESARSTYTREVSEGAIRYKEETGAIFARHERDGLPPSQIYPHPDDVIIDLGTGEVTTDGPMSKEQAGAQKVLMGDMMKNVSRFFDVKKALTQDPSNREPQREFKGLNEVISFYETYSQRRSRHEAFRQARNALQDELTRGGGSTAGRKGEA
jgi:hypothetical protein